MDIVDAKYRRTLIVVFALALIAGCGGSDTEDEVDIANLGLGFKTDEDGNLYQELDTKKDGTPDIRRVYEEVPDPNDPSVTTMRKLRKHIDVNNDGKFNIVRHYSEEGALKREEVDTDLDGRFDAINYIDAGDVLRKELLDPETGRVVAVRYYDEGEILRVEKDLSGDSKIDYWEYYERGILDRIGRDLNADGRADSWQTR